MDYRLGIDIGTNSIGWSVIALDGDGNPTRIERVGARVFPDGRNPKDGTSLAAMRRGPRQQRRRRDRYLRRRARLLQALVRFGLMPSDEAARKALVPLDPYALRARGLDAPLTPYELGRALFHLSQRRGFRSNRKTDAADEKESGKIKLAISRLRSAMQVSGARTVGEFLHQRHAHTNTDGTPAPLPVRARLRGQGATAAYDLYLDRSMIAEEFDALWAAQRRHHPQLLSEEARATLRDTLLYQRELLPVDPGRCTFEPSDPRAPLALPSAQRFRLLQELNHLRVLGPDQRERALTLAERDRLLAELARHRKMSFSGMRRKLRLPEGTYFSLEDTKRDGLLGDETAAVLAKDGYFGARWHTLPLADQCAVVEDLLSAKEDAPLIERLRTCWQLDAAAAERVAAARLPEGYLRLGRQALGRITPHLEQAVITYDKAVQAAGYAHHSFFYTGEFFEQLPYYGQSLERHVSFGSGHPDDPPEKRYGRIANPTVHIGLNQLRKLVNALIQRYGHPKQIVLELARELKLSARQREAIEREQKINQDRNARYRQRLDELGLADSGENRLKLRLWEELNYSDPLDRRCVFSGEQISIERLFSPEVEIEHLLPFSRTLDDGVANKTVSLRRANRDKAGRTPFEAFGHSPPGYVWEAILERVARLPAAKRWRFAPDALTRFAQDGDFLARHLNETRYLSRLAKEYLTAICPPDSVWVTPGRLTQMLRGKWGLNQVLSPDNTKNRNDHRHHAVDATVVALTDRSTLQRMAAAAARAETQGTERLLGTIPEPFAGLRTQLAAAVQRCVISHKPDHGVQAALHNDTAYGFVGGPDAHGRYTVVHRVALADIKKSADLADIRDDALRTRLQAAVAGVADGAELKAALARFSEQTGIRRVRVTETLSVIPIKDRRSGQPYKAYKGDANYCYEIVRTDTGRWDGDIVTSFEANQPSFRRDPAHSQKGKSLVMRLCKNDLVAIEEPDGARRILRVVKFSPGQIVLVEHFEAGNLKARDAAKDDPFKYLTKTPGSLKELRARRVFVDLLGYVKDPGFRE